MSEEKREQAAGDEKKNDSRSISRRKFALGAAAVFGAYSSADACARAKPKPASGPPAAQSWNFEKSDEILRILDERHITDIDLRQVIEYGENTDEKLHQPDTNRFLAKSRIGDVYFYVEYSTVETGYRIHTAYTHRFVLEGDTQWPSGIVLNTK